MAEETGQEKTEQATEKRRRETRNRGQVARSMDLNSVVILVACFIILMVFSDHFINGLGENIRGFFNLSSSVTLSVVNTRNLFIIVMLRYFIIIMPVFIFLAIVGVLVNLLQVGFLFTGEPLIPKLEKISPLAGMKRLFSKRSVETLLKDVLKIIVVGWIGFSAIKGMMSDILNTAGFTAGQIISFTGNSVFNISMKILIGYAVLAILDYSFQRWDYEQSMMMTRQEIKEEMKQMEGDPLLRARVRSVQREMARRRMMEDVPEAEVVITNPTEIAVALSYEAGMPAPVVVAKGRRLIAERIRNIAKESGVPIVENVILAQALYKAVDVGQSIPADLFTAVAEVLAYVYQLKGKKVV
ncbi:flagellar biosynthesis protein FlhB [Candidatus Latescibacterota bacterium]